MKEDLFDKTTYQLCIDRINKITNETNPQWGKMTSAQMLAHCAEIQEVNNGAKLKVKTPLYIKLIKPMIKKMVIKGGYKKGLPTHPAYFQNEDKNFDAEKTRLLDALEAFYKAGKEKAAATRHDFFGMLTAEEKGRAMFNHLDHHLKQFGV